MAPSNTSSGFTRFYVQETTYNWHYYDGLCMEMVRRRVGNVPVFKGSKPQNLLYRRFAKEEGRVHSNGSLTHLKVFRGR